MTSQDRPARSEVCFHTIPLEMRLERRWVTWGWRKAVDKEGQWTGDWTKEPLNPLTGGNASSTNADTWCDFDTTRDAFEAGSYDGVGFVLGDGWAGIDLDGCRDPETGELSWGDAMASIDPQEIITRLDSYTEISPTGTGIHIIVRGSLPPGKRQKAISNIPKRKIELYDGGRYFTVTGWAIHGGRV